MQGQEQSSTSLIICNEIMYNQPINLDNFGFKIKLHRIQAEAKYVFSSNTTFHSQSLLIKISFT